MPDKNAVLTAGEWNVMECLWENSPQTVTQLAKRLAETVGWAKSTSLTVISRMEAKGQIYCEAGGRAKQYYPAVAREDAVRRETKSFLRRVYSGSVGMMMNSMIGAGELSAGELAELRAILERAEKERGDD